MTDARSWRSQARCRVMDPQMFYPKADNAGKIPLECRLACQACPVFNQCYDWSLRNEDYGFWAGMTEQERRRRRVAAGINVRKWLYDTRMLSSHGTDAGFKRHKLAGEDPCISCYEAHARMKTPEKRERIWI